MTASHDEAAELSCRIIRPLLLGYAHYYGEDALRSVLRAAEISLDADYFSQDSWVSFDVGLNLINALANNAGDLQFIEKAGVEFTATPEAMGKAFNILKAFGSPRLLYGELIKRAAVYNRVGILELKNLSETTVEFTYKSQIQEPNRNFCRFRLAQFRSYTTLWGLPPARAVETSCQVNGGDCCSYSLSWPRKTSRLVPIVTGLICGAGTFSTAQHFVSSGDAGVWAVAGGMVTALCAGVLGLRSRLRERDTLLANHNVDAVRALEELEQRYADIQTMNLNLERTVEDRTRELKEASEKLQLSYEQMKTAGELKSRFFSHITHELRTPLTLMLSPLEVALDGEVGDLTPYQIDHFQRIWSNGLRLLKLINNLLDLSKLEEQFFRIAPVEVDLQELLNELVAFTEPLAARKDIKLILEKLPKDNSGIYGDKQYLERVFVNLLANALKFTGRDGTVRIRVERDTKFVAVRVADTGIGIPKDQQNHIFERFRQADNEVVQRYGGTGIGLAFAKEMMELHGGEINLTSVPGQGATFTVRLRIGDAHFNDQFVERRGKSVAVLPDKRADNLGELGWDSAIQLRDDYRFLYIRDAAEQRRVARPSVSGKRRTSVLVVEDNPDILTFIQTNLRGAHTVFVAENGNEGLAVAMEKRPDVILTDYMMPGMDGVDMIAELKRLPRLANIPIIMLSAKTDLEGRLEALGAGADVYISKPFSPRELHANVDALLEKRGQQSAELAKAQTVGLEMLAAGLAHEINNPLTHIKSAHFIMCESADTIHSLLSDTASSTLDTPKVLKQTEKMLKMRETAGRGILRIQKVVDLIRRYAQEGFERRPTRVELDSTLRDVAEIVGASDAREVEVHWELAAPVAALFCDPHDIRQAFRNVIQNAIDASFNGGNVWVVTRCEQAVAVVEIRDEGPGIDPDDLGRIFTPFFSTKAVGSGMGIGLTIAQKAAENAKGKLQVTSTKGAGTIFKFVFPLAAET
jgi:signal transduction histidine kinase